MKDSAEDGDITGAPVLAFRLRLAAAMVRMAGRWLRAAHRFATVVVDSDGPDSIALAATAASAKTAAARAAEAPGAPDDACEVVIALGPLMIDISELVIHLDLHPEIVIDPAVDTDARRRIDLSQLVERLPRLCFALAEFGGAGHATLTLAPDPDGGADDLVLAGAMADASAAAPVELARIAFKAPLAKRAESLDDATTLDVDAPPAAAREPSARRGGAALQDRDHDPGISPVDAPWIAVIERSPTVRMILEDLVKDLPLVAQLATDVDDLDDATLSHPQLRGVVFDPSAHGVDWRGLLARISAAGGSVKAIAMMRCSTREAAAYEEAGFTMVIDRPVSARELRTVSKVCAG